MRLRQFSSLILLLYIMDHSLTYRLGILNQKLAEGNNLLSYILSQHSELLLSLVFEINGLNAQFDKFYILSAIFCGRISIFNWLLDFFDISVTNDGFLSFGLYYFRKKNLHQMCGTSYSAPSCVCLAKRWHIGVYEQVPRKTVSKGSANSLLQWKEDPAITRFIIGGARFIWFNSTYPGTRAWPWC